MNHPQPAEPKLVLNDFSNRHINIQPLFKYLHEFRRDSPAQVAERLEEVIRFVSLNFDPESDTLELKNTLDVLFQLKDVFGNLSEFKPS